MKRQYLISIICIILSVLIIMTNDRTEAIDFVILALAIATIVIAVVTIVKGARK